MPHWPLRLVLSFVQRTVAERWGQPGLGGWLLLPQEVLSEPPPSGVSSGRAEPCRVFDQIWWYLLEDSSASQLLSHAVETCPGQINLVTFRSFSPCLLPLANSCKWPRWALSKTGQGRQSVPAPLPAFHSPHASLWVPWLTHLRLAPFPPGERPWHVSRDLGTLGSPELMRLWPESGRA